MHCCIHSQTVIATLFSCEVNRLACTPTNSCPAVAWLGLFGLPVSLSPVRKLPHPTMATARPR